MSYEPSARTRLRELIIRTRDAFGTDPKPPMIRDLFMGKHFDTLYRTDRPVIEIGFSVGLSQLIMKEAKAWQGDPDEPIQLELFPEEERATAERIGVKSVYVPSAESYQPVHKLTAAEALEAAEWLEAHAASCMQRAGHLRRLARLRGA
jgi:hypothetical protein